MLNKNFRTFQYKGKLVIVNIDNISSIEEDNGNTLICFAGDGTDCVRVSESLDDVCFTITGSLPQSLNPSENN